ncbi:MAG: protein tyrosine phosphatase [Parashewanella sp.]
MFEKILVVCVGNICRSPTGEALLKTHLPNLKIESAGIATEKSKLLGKAAEKNAEKVAAQNGVTLIGHSAQQLSRRMCNEFDLILVMEHKHIEAVTNISPEARGKTMLFGQWIGQKDIPDPYQKSIEAFEHAYQLIEKAAKAWSEKL